MLHVNEINRIINFYIDNNNQVIKEKINYLEDFRTQEIKLKDYVEVLNELEKKQHKINLKEFNGLKIRTIEILKDFNPKDIDLNIKKLEEMINFFEQIELDLIEVSESLVSLKRIWTSFLKRNDEFRKSVFNNYVEEKFIALKRTIESVTPQEIGLLNSDIENEKQDIEKIIVLIEKLKEYKNLNIFLGKENIEIEKNLSLLIDTMNDISIHDFIEKAKDCLAFIDIEKKNVVYGRKRVKVFKFINKTDPSIYKYTVQFGSYFVRYESFFDSSNLKIEDTGQYIYLEDYPIKGIFSGKEVVEKLMIDNDYLNAVEVLSKKSQITFLLLGLFILTTTSITAFLNEFIIIANLIISLLILISFNPIMKRLKSKIENIFKLEDIFVFTKLNFFIVSEGDDLQIKDILIGIIQNFDNTILNQEDKNNG